MSKRKFHIPSLDDSSINPIQPAVTSHFKPGQIINANKLENEASTSGETVSSSVPKNTKSATSGHGDNLPKPTANFNKDVGQKNVPMNVVPNILDNPDEPGITTASAITHSKPTSEASTLPLPAKNCIMVNSRQNGNPLLKNIRNVAWEFCEIEPDYIMSPSACALFLSLRYHNLYPQYIHERLKSLGKGFQLRVLLIHIDVSDPFSPLKDLSKIAILTDCTLLLAWSPEEAGRIIETYKVFENKSPDLIMERQESDIYTQIIDSISSVRSVNRTDATTLLSTFQTLERLSQAMPEELSLCPGMGLLKAKRLYELFRRPFIEAERK